jgi:transcription elongation factor Elf1
MSEPFHKLLKDFPKGVWFEAADGCEACGAKYKVRVTQLYSSVFGEVEWAITHKPDCPERFTEDMDEFIGEGKEFTESDWDNAGWEFMPNTFTFQGKQYYPLKTRANIAPCLECGKLVVGVPLILFIDKGVKGELDFCWSCVKKLGVMEMITKEVKRK